MPGGVSSAGRRAVDPAAGPACSAHGDPVGPQAGHFADGLQRLHRGRGAAHRLHGVEADLRPDPGGSAGIVPEDGGVGGEQLRTEQPRQARAVSATRRRAGR
nr:hypothetical protein KitaXyl93_65390 [Kitasatospora sp. Xyl93]